MIDQLCNLLVVREEFLPSVTEGITSEIAKSPRIPITILLDTEGVPVNSI